MLFIEVTGLEAAARRVSNLPKQLRFATAKALTETAFAARTDVQAAMHSVFDRPTPWIEKTTFVKPATPATLEAQVYFKYLGGKSVDPSNVLMAEVTGGGRKAKRVEVALRRVGLLPADRYVVPGKGAPLDAYGNVPGPFIVRLLAYFQAFGEQGYRANMTDKGRARLGKVKRVNGFQTVRGVQYFVSRGPGTRVASARAAGSMHLNSLNGMTQHLPMGIWSRSGIHGSEIKPILLFVRAPSYRVRFRVRDVVERTMQRELPSRQAKWLGIAISTAR